MSAGIGSGARGIQAEAVKHGVAQEGQQEELRECINTQNGVMISGSALYWILSIQNRPGFFNIKLREIQDKVGKCFDKAVAQLRPDGFSEGGSLCYSKRRARINLIFLDKSLRQITSCLMDLSKLERAVLDYTPTTVLPKSDRDSLEEVRSFALNVYTSGVQIHKMMEREVVSSKKDLVVVRGTASIAAGLYYM